MSNEIINLKNLNLAKIRYFDKKMNGAEVSSIDAYAFLYKNGDEYINIFSPEDSYPVYGRVPYSNTTRSGEDFGTKIIHLAGEEKSGPCYIIEQADCCDMFGRTFIRYDELKNSVIRSSKFFPDRVKLMSGLSKRNYILNYNKIKEDRALSHKFNEYLNAERETVVYK